MLPTQPFFSACVSARGHQRQGGRLYSDRSGDQASPVSGGEEAAKVYPSEGKRTPAGRNTGITARADKLSDPSLVFTFVTPTCQHFRTALNSSLLPHTSHSRGSLRHPFSPTSATIGPSLLRLLVRRKPSSRNILTIGESHLHRVFRSALCRHGARRSGKPLSHSPPSVAWFVRNGEDSTLSIPGGQCRYFLAADSRGSVCANVRMTTIPAEVGQHPSIRPFCMDPRYQVSLGLAETGRWAHVLETGTLPATTHEGKTLISGSIRNRGLWQITHTRALVLPIAPSAFDRHGAQSTRESPSHLSLRASI